MQPLKIMLPCSRQRIFAKIAICMTSMNFVQKWALLAVKLKKFSDLIINAHFEAFFQIYPSMLEHFTGVLTILTLVETNVFL